MQSRLHWRDATAQASLRGGRLRLVLLGNSLVVLALTIFGLPHVDSFSLSYNAMGERAPRSKKPPQQSGRELLGIHGLAYFPDVFSAEAQSAILTAVDGCPWLDDLRRRVQHFGYRYDYRKRSIDRTQFVGPLPDFAVAVADALLARGLLEDAPDQMIVNEYLPGQGIAAHVDCEPCFKDGIATVSLGSACQMDFISVATQEVRSHLLSPGSVLALSGDARYVWKHRIMARKSDGGSRRGRRVSLTFRTVILDTEQ